MYGALAVYGTTAVGIEAPAIVGTLVNWKTDEAAAEAEDPVDVASVVCFEAAVSVVEAAADLLVSVAVLSSGAFEREFCAKVEDARRSRRAASGRGALRGENRRRSRISLGLGWRWR